MTAASGGLLIVNADDWGHDRDTTEAIAEAFEVDAITSTTAMVFMEDSCRAAERSRAYPGLGFGLHLNLVEEFTDPSVPPAVRERQRRFIEYFRLLRLRRWWFDPRARSEVARLIADQFQAFHDLYGRAPTHMDGHHHCHLAADVLLSPAVPRETPIRNALSDAHRPNVAVRALREARRRLVDGHYPSTDYFFSIADSQPALGGARLQEKLALANAASVELMVHPAFPGERRLLGSPEWRADLHGRPLGSFADLGT